MLRVVYSARGNDSKNREPRTIPIDRDLISLIERRN
jgi:hypothetical protein